VDWLIRRLLADPRRYDAIAIFDADSQVDAGFLVEVSRYLASGAQVIQGRHVIANAGASRFAALADADMRLNNRIRNQAKTNLGLSARLMGDAMVFRRDVLERHPWAGAESLTEDRDYGIYLATQGVRIHYAANAISVGQAVSRWGDATPQRLRWYGGAFDLQRRYLAVLAGVVWRRRSLDALDKLLELALPPFSLLALGSVLLLVIQGMLAWLGRQSMTGVAFSAGLALVAACFPFVGLAATGAPRAAYRALLAGPVYILWRAWISVRVRLRPRSIAWIRTRRAGER
jgi:cellulose synthase/poly-beta-1,6-N-acetylglucosamine synthase-like glycosyltransferase